MKGEPGHPGPKGERGKPADEDINETIIHNCYIASTAIQISQLPSNFVFSYIKTISKTLTLYGSYNTVCMV